MRDILFRGKRKDNGEWVEGDLIVFPKTKRTKIMFPKSKITKIMIWNVADLDFDAIEVNSETVGQFTGLTDKNGKRIFEGDMLKPFDDEIDKMVVEFHHGSFLLCLYGERGYMGESGWVEDGNYGALECEPLSSYGDDVEVIGNIHDNPEILKGGDN